MEIAVHPEQRGRSSEFWAVGSWRASQRHRRGWMLRVVLEDKVERWAGMRCCVEDLDISVDAEETLEMLEEGAM